MVAAVAAPAAGPGWANTPIIVVGFENGELVVRWLQPDEQSPPMRTLYNVAAAANTEMVRLVRELWGTNGEPT